MSAINSRLRGLPDGERNEYEAIIDGFEKAWGEQPDTPPDISDFLPPPAREPLHSLVLVGLVKSEIMELQRRRQVWISVEDYARRLPELASDTQAITELRAWSATG